MTQEKVPTGSVHGLEGYALLGMCLLFMFLVLAFSPKTINGSQVNYTVSIYTDQKAYFGNATIKVSGFIKDIGGDDVLVEIRNPSGSAIASSYVPTDEYSGSYDAEFRGGGEGWAQNGTYIVTVSWQFCPTTISNSTTFAYTAFKGSTNSASLSSESVRTVTPCGIIAATSGSAPTQSSSSTAGGSNSLSAILTIVVVIVVVLILGASVLISRVRRQG